MFGNIWKKAYVELKCLDTLHKHVKIKEIRWTILLYVSKKLFVSIHLYSLIQVIKQDKKFRRKSP